MKISKSDILNIVNEVLSLNLSLSDEQVLLNDLGMDSMSLIRIIVKIETDYDLTIDDNYLLVDKMNTLKKIFIVVGLEGESNG